AELKEIFAAGQVCRLALSADPAPYIVPLSYGYRENVLYFHAAGAGRKIDLLHKNPQAGFAIDIDLGVIEGEAACNWSTRYRSLIGHGRVEFVESPEEKRRVLDIIMAQYTDGEFSYPEKAIKVTTVFKLLIAEVSGKRSGV
ncbi:MAG: pyridoxamine 5'-phosphate oxidase family protein, partial [Desulfuromonadales bacterium]|nr:pyridoxamine 5'-phosphate oxidase family protein [Desulfuromonadales bacterium]